MRQKLTCVLEHIHQGWNPASDKYTTCFIFCEGIQKSTQFEMEQSPVCKILNTILLFIGLTSPSTKVDPLYYTPTNIYSVAYSLQDTLYSVQYRVYSVQRIVQSVDCPLQSVKSGEHNECESDTSLGRMEPIPPSNCTQHCTLHTVH